MPFAVYADFECLLEPTKDESRVRKHIPHSVAYDLKCVFDDTLSKFAIKRGPDFIVQPLEIAKMVNSNLNNIIPMNALTPDQKRGFHNATNCHICEQVFRFY